MTFFVQLEQFKNRISGVMVSVLASCAVDREFEPRLGQTKVYEIGKKRQNCKDYRSLSKY